MHSRRIRPLVPVRQVGDNGGRLWDPAVSNYSFDDVYIPKYMRRMLDA